MKRQPKINELTRKRIDKALRHNMLIHKYVMALDHALLWIAALSLAAYFHVSESYSTHEALLFSTLVAYGAYLCESGLNTVRVAASSSEYYLNFRKAAMWHWIGGCDTLCGGIHRCMDNNDA